MNFDTSMFDLRPKAAARSVVQGPDYRFTVLTSRLIRMEYSADGCFEDRATQLAFCRNLDETDFTVRDRADSLEIETEHLILYYDKQPFSPEGLSVFYKGNPEHKLSRWFYHGEPVHWQKKRWINSRDNLGGTCRTLDGVDGEVPLDDGLVQQSGFYALEDNDSMVLTDRGWFEKTEPRTDLYLFSYMHDHRACIRDFLRLLGKMPMIPRYALGNWWSRYYKYTEDSYMELMDQFSAEGIPLSVAVIDMDWHLVKLPDGLGSGWTGYTWNRDFFPEPRRFLQKLHERSLAVTLNVHPHDGVRSFEECYPRAARAAGMDPEEGKTVRFRPDDEASMHVLLDEVLHPMEDDGVDFWWLDWQQFDMFKPGYQPLWMLNHCFYTDNARRGTYPMTFSRYAGPSSSRYPVGFSGDTVMTWESLDFQPYFTNTATNIGYSWWSHDIGGHARGIWDDELQVRWLQYGVFSPILRLHSGNNPFMLKEPWNFPPRERAIFRSFMRLRHQLIPYLYTMNYRNHTEGRALTEPLYYEMPERTKLTQFRNQFLFGSQLMVCPITSKMNPVTLMGCVDALLPEGVWFDFFSHRAYQGGRHLELHRTLEEYPVLARAGAIVPQTAECALKNGAELPETLQVDVFCGADGSFTMYEDDGQLHDTRTLFTDFELHWGRQVRFTVRPRGCTELVSARRTYQLRFIGTKALGSVLITADGADVQAKIRYSAQDNALLAEVCVPSKACIEVCFQSDAQIHTPDILDWTVSLLPRLQYFNESKEEIYKILRSGSDAASVMSQLLAAVKDTAVLSALAERLSSFPQK